MKALLIHNVGAGARDRRGEIETAVGRLAEAGWQVRIAPPEPERAERLLRDGVQAGLDVAVVAGGDGSLNRVIQILAHTPTALGVIPTGTANVWARDVGIPLDIPGATSVLLRGQTLQADLGQANERYFLAIAGVGFDAAVTSVVRPAVKRRLGMLAYVIAATVEAFRLRGEEAILSLDDRTIRRRILMVAACNTRLYGGVLRMAPEAVLDDGLLDVPIFYGRGIRTKFRHTIMAFLGLHRRDPEVEFLQTSLLRVESRNPLPVQVDGDYLGTTPVEFLAAPGALRVIVPPGPHPQFRFQVSDFRFQGPQKPET